MVWYKQDRGLFERPWAKDASMVAVYVYLHCCAYLQDGRLHGQLVRRGSCPTTRAAIMEATGLTESEVKLRLKRLKQYGEIIVKTSNKGMIITLCDYDSYNQPEDLFGAYSVRQDTTPDTRPDSTLDSSPETLYIDIKKEDNKSIRSHYIPSNNERENEDSYEIKKLYNKTFEGLLPEWKRLTKDMTIKIRTCVGRYGRASVDMVFEQVKSEKFSLGENKTGFIANHSFIFELKNYEAYLSRYELRHKRAAGECQRENTLEVHGGRKGPAGEPQGTRKGQRENTLEVHGEKPVRSWVDAYSENDKWRPE